MPHAFPTRRSSDLFTPPRDLRDAVQHRARGKRARSDHVARADAVEDRERDAPRQRHQRGGLDPGRDDKVAARSEEHTSELQSLMRISYAVFCMKKKKVNTNNNHILPHTHIN